MPFNEYTRQFTPSTPFVKPKLIEAGSQEERFARHRCRFAGIPFDLNQHNVILGFVAWKIYNHRAMKEHDAWERERQLERGEVPEAKPEPSSPRKRRRAMISRRSFVIGTGAFLTAGFLADAKACIRETGRPLLIPPRRARETLFAYPGVPGFEGVDVTLLTLGEAKCFPTDPPRWRDFLLAEGYRLERLSDFKKVYDDWYLKPTELREPVHEVTWTASWEVKYSPAARAYHLLEGLQLDSRVKGLTRAGRLNFYDAPSMGCGDFWVEAKDDLAVSLLQARLRELDLPICVRIGDTSTL